MYLRPGTLAAPAPEHNAWGVDGRIGAEQSVGRGYPGRSSTPNPSVHDAS